MFKTNICIRTQLQGCLSPRRELLVPCKLTGRYDRAPHGGIDSTEVELCDGRTEWVDPNYLCESDGGLIEDITRELYLVSPGPVLDPMLLRWVAIRHPDIFPWA